MRKRALFSPACIACLGVAMLALPAQAEVQKLHVYVQNAQGKIVTKQVSVAGQQTAAKQAPSSPAVFAVEESKVEIQVDIDGKSSAAGVNLPAGDVHTVLVILAPDGTVSSARVVTQGDELATNVFWTRVGPQQVQAPLTNGLTRAPYAVVPSAAASSGVGCAAGTVVTQNTDPNTITALNSVSCNAGGLHADNFYARLFDLAAFAGQDIQCVDWAVEESVSGDGGGVPYTINVYDATGCVAGDGPDASCGSCLTLIDSFSGVVADGTAPGFVTSPVSATIPASGSVLVELFTPDGQADGHSLFIGSNPAGQSGPTYLAAADCGITCYTDTAGIGFPGMHWVVELGVGNPVPGACCDTTTGTCTDGVTDCEGEFTPGATCGEVTCEIVIPGDECEDCVASGPGQIVGTTADNTGSTGDDTSCGFADDIDEWICYTATCNGTATASTCNSAAYDTTLAVFGDCVGTELACNDDATGCGLTSEVSWAITAGTTYNVRVSGFNGDSGDYTLDISEVCDVPDTGQDDCVAGPSAIAGEGTFPFDNTAASTDGPEECVKFGSGVIDNDVWFCWTADCTGDVRIETCGLTGVDTKLAVYDGCACPAGPGTSIACNDDTCGLQSQVQFAATAGNSYLIRLGTFPGAAGGPGEFSITCIETGTACNVTEGVQDYDTSNASQSNNDFIGADQFSPNASGSITEACWWGAYLPAVAADDFTLTYYADAGGIPGAIIGGPFAQGADLTVSGPIDTGDLVAATAPIYSYSGTHPAVSVTSGECYWIEVRNLTGGATWYWEWSLAGDSVCVIDGTPPDGYDAGDIENTHDLAWAVNVTLGDPAACIDLPACGDEGTGDCFMANGTPFCDDADCCNTVCAVDPFCCDTEWDGICADEAIDLCQPTGACCLGPAGCQILSEADCGAAGGLYQGDDTLCTPDPCDPIGACCINGVCGINTEANCDAAGGIYNGDGTDCSSNGPSNGTASSSPALAIPDNSPAGVSDTLNYPNSTTIGGVEVSLDVTHTWVGDLCVSIEHGGTTVSIVERINAGPCDNPGGFGCDGDNMSITLSDGAATPVNNAACGNPTTGVYIPENALSAFSGLDSAGDWTITISDNAGGDLGSLDSWSIEVFEQGQDPCDPVGACCCPTESDCTVTTEADCTEVWLGEGTNCDLPPGDTTVVDSGAIALAIPDNDPVTGVSHSLNMGMDFTVTDVNVSIQSTHTWVGDLCVSLEHGGTTVSLLERINAGPCDNPGGFGCAGDNMDVELDDAGGSAINDATCGDLPAVSGIFIPQEALSAFNGMSSAGSWTITVTDNAGGDLGTLDSWSLALTAPSEGGGPCVGQCSVCGDGVVEGSEECDDGNTADGDCCSSTCTYEAAGSACGDGANTECTAADTCDGAGNCEANNEADGTLCGAGATECSGQDTCVAGNCAANHLPSGTACGAPADPENCFTGDACTGGGVCQPGTIITECINDDGCCNAAAGCNFENDNDCPEGVPTVSEWGLVILALLLAVAAKVYWNRREAIA